MSIKYMCAFTRQVGAKAVVFFQSQLPASLLCGQLGCAVAFHLLRFQIKATEIKALLATMVDLSVHDLSAHLRVLILHL